MSDTEYNAYIAKLIRAKRAGELSITHLLTAIAVSSLTVALLQLSVP